MSANVAAVLERQARCRGQLPAIVDARRSVTFSQLNQEATLAARDLFAAGLRAGDRAVLLCPMSIELYVTLIAMFRAGITAVVVDPSAGLSHVDACLDRLRPRGLAAVPRAHLLRLVSRAVRRIPVRLAIGGGVPWTSPIATSGSRARCSEALPIAPVDGDAPALITFTSGSTGLPKVVVRTHEFLRAQHQVLAEDLRLVPGELDLATLPVFVLANLASGVTSVIADADLRAPGAIDPARLIRQVRSVHPSRVAASPALLMRLADHLARTGERLYVRRIFTGGAPAFPTQLDALAAVAPGASITAVYGSTEAEPIATLPYETITDLEREATRAGAGLPAGAPVRSIEVRVIPDRWGTRLGPYEPGEFDRLSLPSAQAGEIVVSGPHVLAGYLDGVGDEDTKIRVGGRVWHRTGDAGYLDAAGRVWLLGRCSARVSDARGTVYPLAVEAAASDVPGVKRSAFIQHRGRRLLVIDIRSSDRANALAELRPRLAWAHLDDTIVARTIPVDRRHNGKVDYPALRRMVESRA